MDTYNLIVIMESTYMIQPEYLACPLGKIDYNLANIYATLYHTMEDFLNTEYSLIISA
jgi:hypothetical protein